jgi:type VI protein secretion system component VasA
MSNIKKAENGLKTNNLSIQCNSYEQCQLKHTVNQQFTLFTTPVHKLFTTTGQNTCKPHIQCVIFAT